MKLIEECLLKTELSHFWLIKTKAIYKLLEG